MRRSFKIGIVSTLLVAGIVYAANGPVPSVGLYWLENVDPSIGGGVSAPLNQLLIRTDTPSLYYKSGSANTAWTRIGTGTGGGGFSGTPNTLAMFTGSGTTIGDSPLVYNGSTLLSTAKSLSIGTDTLIAPDAISGGFATNANGTLRINPFGYQGGTTRFEDTEIDDGKGTGAGHAKIFVDGSVGNVGINTVTPNVAFDLDVNGQSVFDAYAGFKGAVCISPDAACGGGQNTMIIDNSLGSVHPQISSWQASALTGFVVGRHDELTLVGVTTSEQGQETIINGTADATGGDTVSWAIEGGSFVSNIGTGNHHNVGGLFNAANGQINDAIETVTGNWRNIGGNLSINAIDATTVHGTGVITSDTTFHSITGTSAFDGGEQIGTSPGLLFNSHGAMTQTFIAQQDSATDVWFEQRSTASGGHKYKLVTSATGGYWNSAGFTFADDSGCSSVGCALWQTDQSTNTFRVYSDLMVGSTTLNGLQAGHIRALGTAATVTCNGTGTPSVTGTDAAGLVTTGVGSTQCTVALNGKTYGGTPVCTANIDGVTPLAIAPAPTATTLVLNFAALTSGTISYICFGLS